MQQLQADVASGIAKVIEETCGLEGRQINHILMAPSVTRSGVAVSIWRDGAASGFLVPISSIEDDSWATITRIRTQEALMDLFPPTVVESYDAILATQDELG